jgi:NTP pyrophosphatase (non-canonical NTP hydrolase)
MRPTTREALGLVALERSRQERLKASGKFAATCADALMSPAEKLAVLVEEVGEVARHLCDARAPDGIDAQGLRDELTQVAAVAVAWLESL